MKNTFWDKISRRYDKSMRKHDANYIKMIERTKSLLTDSDVVLDFGCASGEISVDIATHVQRVHGIDTSAKMIELANQKARDRHIDNTHFNQIDAFDQRLASDSFSAIIAFNIFHLLEDAPSVLARLNDLLTKGGLLISQTPCLSESGWFFRSLMKLVQKLPWLPMLSFLTIPELEALVSNSNFEIFETEGRSEKIIVQWIAARKL